MPTKVKAKYIRVPVVRIAIVDGPDEAETLDVLSRMEASSLYRTALKFRLSVGQNEWPCETVPFDKLVEVHSVDLWFGTSCDLLGRLEGHPIKVSYNYTTKKGWIEMI